MSKAARKMRRGLMKRALAAKVSVAPPTPVQEPTVLGKKPPKMRRLRIPVNDEQMGLLAGAQAKIAAGEAEFGTSVRVILAQHHILEAQVIGILPGRPPKLLIAVPDAKPGSRRKAK